MQRTTEELKAHLIATNDEFRRLAQEHSNYERQIADLESRHHLSSQEQLEEVKLKKLKLHAKDQMMAIMHQYQTHAN